MNQLRGVLVIGMQHDNDIATQLQRFIVTSFLIAAIPQIHIVFDDVFDSGRLRYFECCIGACRRLK